MRCPVRSADAVAAESSRSTAVAKAECNPRDRARLDLGETWVSGCQRLARGRSPGRCCRCFRTGFGLVRQLIGPLFHDTHSGWAVAKWSPAGPMKRFALRFRGPPHHHTLACRSATVPKGAPGRATALASTTSGGRGRSQGRGWSWWPPARFECSFERVRY
jgi:hypothetical protein